MSITRHPDYSMSGGGLRSSLALILVLIGAPSCDVQSAQVAEQPNHDTCLSAEECFAMAVWPKERLGNELTREQTGALRLERLRQLTEKYPASIWAKRAGLLSGVILVERNSAAALPYLRAAQKDFPGLDDYIRYWIGEAFLSSGDAKEAAGMFETVSQAVPDSNLVNQATLRAGEAWYQASDCAQAVPWLVKAAKLNEKEPSIAQALARLATCQLRDNRFAEGRETLKQLWTRFPFTKEAKEAEAQLATNLGGEPWVAPAESYYARAQAFLGQALHAEAIDELKKFLVKDPSSPSRGEAKLKLGIAQVRLKLYDHARETFYALSSEHTAQSDEATVWLARVYLRQGLGEKLLDLCRTMSKRSLSAEQRGQITLFAGTWLEDQAQFEDAIAKYRQVSKSGEPGSQRAEAQWREGWVLYRTEHYPEAISVWQSIADQKDSDFEPQALYWIARSFTHFQNSKARETFHLLCQRFPHTYYCQLAREHSDMVTPVSTAAASDHEGTAIAVSSVQLNSAPPSALNRRMEIEQQPIFQRAMELRTLGLEQHAARELSALTDRFSRDPEVLLTLSVLLNEVGAHHQALRLVRARFREQLERTGGSMDAGVWNAAYPTGLIPIIKMQGVTGVDPFLVAAIIREESQYDWRAVSRVGAIGLMQVMPATASAVAQRHHLPGITREDLFDQETNIRIGVRYVEQLLMQFSGNLVQTIAAYNAGPMVVGSWAAAYRGRSEDEFVELIQYQETRQYVKRVLRSYKEYLRLAGQQKPVS